jgi:hypothetical protein
MAVGSKRKRNGVSESVFLLPDSGEAMEQVVRMVTDGSLNQYEGGEGYEKGNDPGDVSAS